MLVAAVFSLSRSALTVVAAIGDPTRTRTVWAAIAFLVAIGVGLLVLAGWLVRSTRVDPEVLAPLEVMGERSWRSADPVWQRRRLDEVRPAGAQPLEPTAPPPAADADFDIGPRLAGFEDFDDLLRDLGVRLDESASPDRGVSTDATVVAGVARGSDTVVVESDDDAPDTEPEVSEEDVAEDVVPEPVGDEPDGAELDGDEPHVDEADGPDVDEADADEPDGAGPDVGDEVEATRTVRSDDLDELFGPIRARTDPFARPPRFDDRLDRR